MNASGIATRRVSKKIIGPRGKTYYKSERVPVENAPPLNRVGCLDFFDPITKAKLPYTAEALNKRLDEIRMNPPPENRYFDPCTKRLLPNFDALVKRISDIKCYIYKEEGKNQKKGGNSLQLQLHQDIIVQGIRERFQVENDKRFLIGVLPRGGKTYIAGGLILDHLSRVSNAYNTVLWITAAPNETKMQVEKDLIEKFDDFKEFQFVEVKETTTAVSRTSGKPHVVYFISSQLLSLVATGKVRHRPFLDALLTVPKGVDMVFFDEAHKTGTGTATREQLEKIQKLNEMAPIIFLTATYFSVQKEYGILRDNTFLWDYTDVLAARNLASEDEIVQSKAYEALSGRFGEELVDKVLTRRRCNGESFEHMIQSYRDYPDLHFLSADFNPDALEQFETAGIFSEEDGFDMGKLLKIRDGATLAQFKTKGGKILADAFEQFDDIDLVSDFIELIGDYILRRIDSISQRSGSRYKLSENPSLMMFMPTGRKGTNIFFTLIAWSTALMAADWWNERYEVVCVVENETMPKDIVAVNNTTATTQSGIHIVSKNVKETILDLEHKAHSRGKGLIILAGEKLSMGVSLPFVDVVMMLNDKFSPDDIIQKMYRAVTPSPGKKTAFIVDFTPERTLTAIYGYTKAASPASLSPAKVLEILLNTYYWDADIIPKNASEREQLLAHRNTFQGSLRKLYHNAVGNTGEKKEALEAEITRMQRHFLGETRKPKAKISLNFTNIGHPNNVAILRPLQEDYLKKKEAINALKKNILKTQNSTKWTELQGMLENFKTFTKRFANTIGETRKQRKTLNAAETKKVKKASVLTQAATQRLAEKERMKAEIAAAKAVLIEEKARQKAEVVAMKEAAKVAEKEEKARQKAELIAIRTAEKAAKAATATRKRVKTPAVEN